MDEVEAKHILYKTKNSGWFATDYTMNIYRGCSHGCIYCDSRSNCYGIENFDQVKPKKEALRIIRDDLKGCSKKGVIGMGAMSDPYNPLEKTLNLTRHALELINAYGYGVAIATKSDLIQRDIDVLKEIKEHSPVLIKVTITTPYDELSKIVEPHVCPSSKRFETIKKLTDAGIFAGILLMPCLPFIEDDIEAVLKLVDLAYESGAKFIYPAFGMTLREGNREYYYENLDRLYPGISEKYKRIYGNSYQCTSRQAKKIYEAFAKRCDEYGIYYDMIRINRVYRYGYGTKQLKLEL